LDEIVVEPGSTVVAPPLPGRIAVLSVDGDPDEVLDRYLDAFRSQLHIPPESAIFSDEEYDGGTRRLRRVNLNEAAGGLWFVADLVTTDDGAAWLFLDGNSG